MAHAKEQRRERRKLHIRKSLYGTADKPRVFLFRSNRYLYVGVSDDVNGRVLMSLKSDKDVKSASGLGEKLGKMILDTGLQKVVFDRSGYKYHGKVAALADGIRKAGVKM